MVLFLFLKISKKTPKKNLKKNLIFGFGWRIDRCEQLQEPFSGILKKFFKKLEKFLKMWLLYTRGVKYKVSRV